MSCFLSDNFMKLLAKYLSTIGFCWTSSIFSADRNVSRDKDRLRKTDFNICCSDWPDDRFVYPCSLWSAYHNALTGKSPPRTVRQMFFLTPCNWEWSTTDLKTDIVFNCQDTQFHLPHPPRGGLPVESPTSRPIRQVIPVFMVIQ